MKTVTVITELVAKSEEVFTNSYFWEDLNLFKKKCLDAEGCTSVEILKNSVMPRKISFYFQMGIR